MMLLLIPLAAILFRERGRPDSGIPKSPLLVLFGLVIAACALPVSMDNAWAIAVIAAAFALGCSSGLGNPTGAAFHGEHPSGDYEWWQIGPGRRNAWVALFMHGYVRSAGCLVLIPMGHANVAIALIAISTLTEPLAVLIARESCGGALKHLDGHDPGWAAETERSARMWAMNEYLYGGLMAAFSLWAGSFLNS